MSGIPSVDVKESENHDEDKPKCKKLTLFVLKRKQQKLKLIFGDIGKVMIIFKYSLNVKRKKKVLVKY